MTLKHRAILSASHVLLLTALLVSPAGSQGGARTTEEDDLFQMLFGKAPPVESPDERILIAEIAIECPQSFDEDYIRSFAAQIAVGDSMTAGELDALLLQIEEGMEFSNMFYTSSASFERLESEAGADGLVAARVIVKTDEGFWWGFGFSPWDFSIAYNNLSGTGKRLAATLGLNTQALSYRDPSIGFGSWYWAAEVGHELFLRGSRVDPAYTYENYSLSGDFGVKLADDLSLGLSLGYLAFRSPREYFIYPDYLPPSASALALVGLSRDFSSLASAGLRISLGSYSYQRRGGLNAMASLGLDALASSLGKWEIIPRATALGLLRLDAPKLLRLTLRERITYIPKTAEAGIPQALWAVSGELRVSSGLTSGEFASVSRVSLDLDRIAAIGLGFAELGIVPELFYEFGSASRQAYDDDARFQQDWGFLVKAVASMPIGRTFAFGIAFGLEGESNSRIKFVVEVY